jgi:hypothetical protein
MSGQGQFVVEHGSMDRRPTEAADAFGPSAPCPSGFVQSGLKFADTPKALAEVISNRWLRQPRFLVNQPLAEGQSKDKGIRQLTLIET